MLKSLLILTATGLLALLGLVLLFEIFVPLTVFAVKLALLMGLGYVVLRVVKPETADRCRNALFGEPSTS